MAEHAVQGIGLGDAWNKIKSLHPTIHVEYLESYRQQMIDKLVHDRFLDFENSVCKVTFEGVLFSKNGGYVGERKSLGEQKTYDLNYDTRAENNAKRLNNLTLWLMIGSVALAGIEILKLILDYCREGHLISWTAVYLFLSGSLAGICIPLIAKEALNRRRVE